MSNTIRKEIQKMLQWQTGEYNKLLANKVELELNYVEINFLNLAVKTLGKLAIVLDKYITK